MPALNRVKLLRVSSQMLCRLLRDGAPHAYSVVANPLPDDAEIVHAMLDPNWPRTVLLRIASDSYPEVADGQLIPYAEDPQMMAAPPVGAALDGLSDPNMARN